MLGNLDEFGEIHFEKFSGANALLKRLPPTLLESRRNDLAKPDFFLRDLSISSETIPTWMKPEAQSKHPAARLLEENPAEKSITFTLRMGKEEKTRSALKLREHVDNHVIFNELHMPNVPTTVDHDPRHYPFGERIRYGSNSALPSYALIFSD
ncbi:hypothetical protein MMC20_002675 [Loxospora ochrophaea]|nr:hypothetical protein [Loxospora ochrophaea]